jgi:glycosyltransferase involved in cell wall biosynthesis
MLTVVIPNFNQKQFLPRAVASVLTGETRDVEIIIVDDGSTDESEPILTILEKYDPRVRVIRSGDNQGAPTALNAGLAAARGRYISFLGADDFVMPTLYGPLLRELEGNQSAALACSEIAILGTDDSIRGIRPMTAPAFRTTFLEPNAVVRISQNTDNWICNTSTVYRTTMIRAAGGYDPSLGSFCDGFLSRILAFEHGFIFVPGIRAAWRVAADTLSSSTMLDQIEIARLVVLARERLAASIVGRRAPGYPDMFARRLRFSAVRMQFVWNGQSTDPTAVAMVAGGADNDRKVLLTIHRILGFGVPGRVLALAWLFVRLRPIAPLSLILHAARNRLLLVRSRRSIQSWLRKLEIARNHLLGGVASSETLETGSRSRSAR